MSSCILYAPKSSTTVNNPRKSNKQGWVLHSLIISKLRQILAVFCENHLEVFVVVGGGWKTLDFVILSLFSFTISLSMHADVDSWKANELLCVLSCSPKSWGGLQRQSEKRCRGKIIWGITASEKPSACRTTGHFPWRLDRVVNEMWCVVLRYWFTWGGGTFRGVK